MKRHAYLTMLFLLGIGLLSACGGDRAEWSGEEARPAETVMQSGKLLPEQLPQALLQGQFERIHKQMSEEFSKSVTLQDLKELGQSFHNDIDSYLEPVRELTNGYEQWIWINDKNKKGLLAVFDDQSTIHGLLLQPLAPHPETDGVFTQTAFAYPFAGEWYTYWGGTNVLYNYHYEHPGQRYAYDFVIVKDGASFAGDPGGNESYYAFGQDVLAPADGIVASVVNDIPDNAPGVETNTDQPAGNHIVIDHGNGEYSILAHFQRNSIRVQVGDKVVQGDVLGLCGNSGNSSEPHIHFQVSDRPDLAAGQSIRIQWAGNSDLKKGDTAAGHAGNNAS